MRSPIAATKLAANRRGQATKPAASREKTKQRGRTRVREKTKQ